MAILDDTLLFLKVNILPEKEVFCSDWIVNDVRGKQYPRESRYSILIVSILSRPLHETKLYLYHHPLYFSRGGGK